MKKLSGPVRGPMFRSLEVPNFRLFFAGQLVSQIGTWTRMVAATLLVLHLTDSGVAIGVLSACQFGPVLVLGPWMGVVVDRLDKRRLLMALQLAAMAQSVLFTILASMDSPPMLAIYAISLVGGITFALESPTRRSFVVEIVPPEHLQNAIGLTGAMMTSARIFGPAVAGLIVTNFGYAWCFAVDAMSYVAVLVGLYLMDESKLHRPDRVTTMRGQVIAGLRFVRGRTDLSALLAMTALVGSFAFNFQVYLPLIATRSLGGDDGDFTALFSIMSLGSCIGALSTARRTTAELRHVTHAALASGVAALLLGIAPSLELAYPAALLLGVASVSFLTMTTTLVQLGTEPSMRGRVVALLAVVTVGGTPLTGPLLGATADVAGARTAVVVVAIACLAAVLVGTWAERKSSALASHSAQSVSTSTVPTWTEP